MMWGCDETRLWSAAAQAGGLRFETGDDALSYAKAIAEGCVALRRKSGCYGIDHYLRGESYFSVNLASASAKFGLACILRPNGIEMHRTGKPGAIHGICNTVDFLHEMNEPNVFTSGADFAECPNDFTFPVLVRFQRAAEVNQGRVDVDAASFDLTFEVFDGFPEGEINAFGVRASRLYCGVAEGLVKCVASVVGDASCDLPECDRDGGWKAEIVDVFCSLRVNAVDDVRFVSGQKLCAGGIEVRQAFFSGFE